MKIAGREGKEKTYVYFTAAKSAKSCFQAAVLRVGVAVLPERSSLQREGVASIGQRYTG